MLRFEPDWDLDTHEPRQVSDDSSLDLSDSDKLPPPNVTILPEWGAPD